MFQFPKHKVTNTTSQVTHAVKKEFQKMWAIALQKYKKTSQELRMLSSVTLNCQVTKIVMNSGSQLSEMYSVSQMSKVIWIAL